MSDDVCKVYNYRNRNWRNPNWRQHTQIYHKNWHHKYREHMQTPQHILANSSPSQHSHLTIIAGDFNNHHNEWGYKTNNKSGEDISKWANDNDFHLLFDPKEWCTFSSRRRQQEYNPDVALVSKSNNLEPIPTKWEVLNYFSHSQNRPVLISTGICLTNIQSMNLYHDGIFGKRTGLHVQQTLNPLTNESRQRSKTWIDSRNWYY